MLRKRRSGMTKQFNGLVCAGCGGDLVLEINSTALDSESEAGAGSGFDKALQLECNKFGCGRVYTIGYLQHEKAISPPKTEF